MKRSFSTMVALGLLVLTAPVSAQDTYPGADPARCAGMSSAGIVVEPYEIQQGDSCSRIARTRFGDRTRYDLIHQYNADMGPTPHRFRPGTFLCLPTEAPARGSGPPAHITALRQSVRARPAEAPAWRPATLGEGVNRGSRVDVLEAAFAELTFRDTSTVTLRGDTLVVVYGNANRTRDNATAELERGSLRARLGELRGRIRTPGAQVALGGGNSVTSVDGSGTTRVSNHEGAAAEVSDASGAGTVRVSAGQGSEVQRGRRPSPPRPLPAAPRWTDGQPARFVGVPQMTTVSGAWAAVPDARVYRVEISRQRNGGSLVAAVEVPASVTRFEMHRLPAGTYYARVSTIDSSFFESRASRVFEFELVLGQLEQPGGAEDAPDGFDFGDASEEPQPLALWPGSVLTPPDGVVCNGEAGPITLEESGPMDVSCVDAEGASVGLFRGEVRDPSVRTQTESGAMTLGPEPSTHAVLVAHADELPGSARFEASEGYEVVSSERRPDGFALTLRAEPDAPPGELTLHLDDDIQLASIALSAAAVAEPDAAPPAPESPTPEPEEEPSRPLDPEAFGVALQPSLVGLRRARVDGGGGWVAIDLRGTVGNDDIRPRATGGLRVGLLDRALQLELAASFDFSGPFDQQAQRGSGDLWGAAGWAPDLSEEVDVVVELGAYFPTQPGDGGLDVVRLVPSLHLGLRAFDSVLFRTRQSAAFDLNESGNALWASAYGADVNLLGPLTVGAEVGFSLGQEESDLRVLATVGGHLTLGTEHFSVSLAGRAGLPDQTDAVVGPWSMVASVNVGDLSFDGDEGEASEE
ncbi:MAG: hypothetical protein AB8I08_20270 [Sandaracinaceae bacterium]